VARAKLACSVGKRRPIAGNKEKRMAVAREFLGKRAADALRCAGYDHGRSRLSRVSVNIVHVSS
jgi:hypothetical protein